MSLEKWGHIGRKTLLLNILLSQMLFLAVGCTAYYVIVLRPEGLWTGLLLPEVRSFWWLLPGCAALLGVQALILKIAGSLSYFYDELNALLIKRFRLSELAVIFLGSAFTEELLFRGALQVWLGILPAALIFALGHVRYLKRPLLLLEAFLLGILLGLLYSQTASVWICALAHAFINWAMAWAVKTGHLVYEQAK